jgi:hypothetical protein
MDSKENMPSEVYWRYRGWNFVMCDALANSSIVL